MVTAQMPSRASCGALVLAAGGGSRFVGTSHKLLTRVAGKAVVFRANLENVANKAYWVTASGYVTVGAPRTLMLSAAIDF